MRRHLRTTLAAAAVAAAGLLLALAAEARPPHAGGRGGPGGMFLERHAEQLGLEPAQREAIQGLMDSSREAGEPLREQVHELRRGIHELLMSDEPDVEAVMARADALGAAETELHKLRLSTMMGIHAVLTPEQRAQMRELRGELRGFAGEDLEASCAADVEQLCPGVDDPLARAHCLRQNRDALGEDCAEALRCARRKHHKGPWGRFHHGGRGPGPGPGPGPGGGPGGPSAP
jgi:Spy/CpxP family protein refolding chaperone